MVLLRQLTLLISDTFCSCLLEQEAEHGIDVIGIKRIHLLIWQHAAKCIEVCNSLNGLYAFTGDNKVSRSIGIQKSQLFGFCDLDLDQMIFIYELDPYP